MHTMNIILTSSVCISQLLAYHSSISVIPRVITHCPPLVIDAHLHSTLILIGASHQTNISISTVATRIDCSKQIKQNIMKKVSITLAKVIPEISTFVAICVCTHE